MPLSTFYSPARAFLACAAILVGGSILSSPSLAAEGAVSSEILLEAPAQSVEDYIHEALKSSSHTRGYFKDIKALRAFYKVRDFKPYWTDRSRAKSNARDFLDILEESWTHGLNPYQYHLEEVNASIKSKQMQQLANLDVALSDAYIRLSQDLTGIRVNPASMKTSRRFWRKPYKADYVLALLSKQNNIENLMEIFEPQGETYKRLQKELKEIGAEEREAYEEILPIRIGKTLNPSDRHKGVPDLRLRLGLSQNQSEPYLYDDDLAEAVIEFQRKNSLKPDGLIGRQTLEILNKTRSTKMRQLIANLERLRWVEENKPDKFVVVNIPSATLWAVEGGDVQFEMPVIVGRKKRPTNMFITKIDGVRFNPTWTVPPTIKKEDILPKLRENPEYLSQKGMELVMGQGGDAMTIDPVSVDWSNISEDELKYFRMVQTPGRNNPLGRIRVLMPNQYNIYLHDTNQPHYFSRASRAASSGCVRMKEPEKMAEFIMKSRKGWGSEDMQKSLARGKMRDVFINDPIPVYLLYYTVWINEKDELVYGSDLYDHDKSLIKMLSDIDGILIPVDNRKSTKGAMSFVSN